MTINALFKKTILRLKEEGNTLTPDFYMQAFCIEAKLAGFEVEDCSLMNRNISLLTKDLQQEVREYRVSTTQEFIRFLISKINRLTPTQCTKILKAEHNLNHSILKILHMFNNDDANALALETINSLDNNISIDKIDVLKGKWVHLQEKLHKDSKALTQDVTDYQHFASLIISTLVPSIVQEHNQETNNLIERLLKNPQQLTKASIQNDITSSIKLRIALDKQNMIDIISEFDSILDKLSYQIIHLIEQSNSSSKEIHSIKEELNSLKYTNTDDFKITHQKLYTIADTLEEQTKVLSKNLSTHKQTIDTLNDRVSQLEQELITAQEVSREDFLTKLPNKRALEEYLKIKEEEYKRHKNDYAIIMFDIDFFKKINDTYGHEAGNSVLTQISKIFKDMCRNSDLIGRYGGEEFLGILTHTEKVGVEYFAHKIRKEVEKTIFTHQDIQIALTLSIGFAMRSDSHSSMHALEIADKKLYDVKRSGRNNVKG